MTAEPQVCCKRCNFSTLSKDGEYHEAFGWPICPECYQILCEADRLADSEQPVRLGLEEWQLKQMTPEEAEAWERMWFPLQRRTFPKRISDGIVAAEKEAIDESRPST